MLKGIIVDDELTSRESLKILLEEFCDQVQVMALCQNVSEGLEAIRQFSPQIVFLDIQMQRETGFDLLTKVPQLDFEVIFTTAHSEYAIKAFKFSAIDYLLKPIDVEDLKKAIKKVEKKVLFSTSERLEALIRNLKTETAENYKLAIPATEGLMFIKLKDILYCEATSNYTIFHLIDGRQYVVSKTLKEYEDLLTDYHFFRIHHSYLINLQEVKKYIRGEGGYVVLNNNVSLDVSKRKKEAFLHRISTLINH
jgi:two-component system LytT family response regulator